MGKTPRQMEDLDAAFHAHYEQLVRLAYLLTNDRELAEEITQDAFVAAGRRWADVREPGPYLRRSVVNGANSALRRRRVRRANPPTRPDEAELGAEEMTDVLAGLPARQRTVVVLRFWAGCTPTEIAGILDRPAGTIRSDLHRALEHLRRELA